MIRLTIELAAGSADTEVAVGALDAIRRHVDRELTVKEVESAQAAPLSIAYVIDDAPSRGDEQRVVKEALEAAGISTGRFQVTYTDAPDDDPEQETPAWFEEVLDFEALADLVTVSVDIEVSEPQLDQLGHVIGVRRGSSFTDSQRERLREAVLTAIPGELRYAGPISSNLEGTCRLLYHPMPSARVPAQEALVASVMTALATAGVEALRVTAGAYIGDWDHTLFRSVVEK